MSCIKPNEVRIHSLNDRKIDIALKMQELCLELARIDAEILRAGGCVSACGAIGGTIGGTAAVGGTIGGTALGAAGGTIGGTMVNIGGTIGATAAGTIGGTIGATECADDKKES